MSDNKYDYVTVSKRKPQVSLHLHSKSEFFNTPIVYDVDYEKIVLRHATIDDSDRVVKPSKLPNGSYSFIISIYGKESNIEFKKYYFDEDSTEDCVFIYYNE